MKTTSKTKFKRVYIEINTDPKDQDDPAPHNNILRRFKSHDSYSISKKQNVKNIPHLQQSLKEKPIITINLIPNTNHPSNSSTSSSKAPNSKHFFSNQPHCKFAKSQCSKDDSSKQKDAKINSYINSGRKRNKVENCKILKEQSIQEIDTEESNKESYIESNKNQIYNENSNRKLLLESKKGNKEEVFKLLKYENININYQDENGWSALHYSCDEGNLKIVEMLLKFSINPNLKTGDKKSALHLAAKHGYFDISKKLIENGANLNATDNEKNLPIHLCAANNHVELLSFMVEKFSPVNYRNLYGKTPYDLANKDEVKKELLKYMQKDKKGNANGQKNKIHTVNNYSKQENCAMKYTDYKIQVKNISKKTQGKNNIISNKNSMKKNKKLSVGKSQNNNKYNFNNIRTSNKSNICNNNTEKNVKVEEKQRTSLERKNYNIIPKKKEICEIQNKNIIPKQKNLYQSIKIKNHNNLSNTYSRSLSKGKTTNIISNPHSNISSTRKLKYYIEKEKERSLTHKTLSLPKFNRTSSQYIKCAPHSNRRHSYNKNNNHVPQPKVANVQISLEFENQNELSINDPLIKDNNNNNNTPQNVDDTSLFEKQNEITSLIDVSDSDPQSFNDEDQHDKSNNSNEQGKKEENVGPSSFICIGLLGKGSFGEVYLVKHIKTLKLYAMKVLDKDRIMAQNIVKYAMAERNVLSLTSHPFIVKLNYAFQTNEKLFLLLDYCPHGDLANQLLKETRFPEEKSKFYICEIILAIGDLHQKDIIFRDLKPDNVVLDQQGHAMLTDFGLSREGVCNAQTAKSFCGSIAYLAPEIVSRSGHGKAVDWYLVGVLFYEMLVGIPPFFTNNKDQIFNNILKGKLKIPGFVSEPARKVLKRLLKRDPGKRLGSKNDVEEIKEHEYFKNVDWNKVYNREMVPPKIKQGEKNVQLFKEPKLFMDEEENGEENEKEENLEKFKGWSFVQKKNGNNDNSNNNNNSSSNQGENNIEQS